MKRRLFNLAALVSLLMGVAVAGLWVRRVWWATDLWVMNAYGPQIKVVSGKGLRALCDGNCR